MIKNRLKDIGMKVTDLSEYLKLSRPTIYKFIKMYDEGDRKNINKDVLDLFKYIEKNKLIGSKNVIYYILNNLYSDKNTNEVVNLLNSFCNHNPESPKLDFIKELLIDNSYDNYIDYIRYIVSIEKKDEKSETEENEIKNINKKIEEWRKKYVKKNSI